MNYVNGLEPLFEPYYTRRIKYSDRVIAAAWALAANGAYGLHPTHEISKGLYKIHCPELLQELLKYKPKNKTMKQFKNKFAVTGDIIELLKFEKELLKLGYKNTMKSNVFNYRGDGIDYKPAIFITCGLHLTDKPGEFRPAMNNGNADMYNCLFKLPDQFEEALKVASELQIIARLDDGTLISDTSTIIFGAKKLENNIVPCGYTKVYKKYLTLNTQFSMQLSPEWKWFGTDEIRKKYIDGNSVVLTTEDGIIKTIDDTAWCVKSDFTHYCVKKGLDEKSPWPGYKYFHTEANALRHINANKPLFSKNDIITALRNSVSAKKVYNMYPLFNLEYLDGDKIVAALKLDQ